MSPLCSQRHLAPLGLQTLDSGARAPAPEGGRPGLELASSLSSACEASSLGSRAALPPALLPVSSAFLQRPGPSTLQRAAGQRDPALSSGQRGRAHPGPCTFQVSPWKDRVGTRPQPLPPDNYWWVKLRVSFCIKLWELSKICRTPRVPLFTWLASEKNPTRSG